MLDLDKIIERHLTKDKMEGRTFYDGHIVIDLFECVEEIKQLRSALTTMQGAYELGAGTERDDVVAFLRESANAPHPIERGVPSLSPAGRGLLLFHADRIEHGLHKKKDNESP
jgi:hypothetical protein